MAVNLPIRFRTQDTKAAWARKINYLFSPPLAPRLRETPQTMTQWLHELNQLVKSLRASGYVLPKGMTFRFADTKQLLTKKLNVLVKAKAAGTIPVNTVAPAITGSTVQGQVLTASNGTWTGPTPTYTRVWRRNGTAISGATGTTYTLQAADVGATITVTVTATNSNGSATATSAGRGPVTAT